MLPFEKITLIRRLTMAVPRLRFTYISLIIKNNDNFFTQNDNQDIVFR
jgi:hypothetical protein